MTRSHFHSGAPMELVEFLCVRPGASNPKIRSTVELLAGIRGICAGAEDPMGDNCLGDFPKYVQGLLRENHNESWYFTLAELCKGKDYGESCRAIERLIQEWKGTEHTVPGCSRSRATVADDNAKWHAWCKYHPGAFFHAAAWGVTADTDTFELMQDVLREPFDHVPCASSLREILVFLWCILLCRRPWHGAVAGIGDFDDFVRNNICDEGIGALDTVLHSSEQDTLRHSCGVIADLIKQWLEATETFFYSSSLCPVCQGGPVGFRRCSNGSTIVLVCDTCHAVWLRPDALAKESAILQLSGNHFVESLNCSIGISAGARWAALDDIRKASLDSFVVGVRKYGSGAQGSISISG